jgi:hypothetical protein
MNGLWPNPSTPLVRSATVLCAALCLSYQGKHSCHVYPVAKVGLARLPCPQKRNISPRRCLNPLRFLVFDWETADEPEKSHAPLTKTVERLLGGTAHSQH